MQGYTRVKQTPNPYPTVTSRKNLTELEAVCSSMEAEAREAKTDVEKMKHHLASQKAQMESEMHLLKQRYEEEIAKMQEMSRPNGRQKCKKWQQL